MATPIDWTKFTFDGKVLSGYDGNPLGGTYGSWWDQGNAKPGAVTPWGTTIGDLGYGGGANKSAYDQFLNLQGGAALPENIRFSDGVMETYTGDPNSGWVQGGATDGDIYPYQNKLELNSGFHRYDINNLLQTGGGEHASAWQNILPYLKGEDLLAYDPQWGIVAKDSKSAERIGALIDTIHGSYAGPEQRAALRSSLIAMASLGLGAALAPAAGAAGGAGEVAGAGVADAASGASNIFGAAGDSIFGGYMPGSELANTIGNVSGLNPYDAWSVTGGINGTGNSVLGNLFSNPSIFGENPFSFGGGAGTTTSPSLWDQIKDIYNSPEVQTGKDVLSGAKNAYSLAQQSGLLGGGSSGGGGSQNIQGLLGQRQPGRSFAELSPYARGLLRG